ncbi:MAG: hypothetical protein AABX71_01525 [Nanoarchaeota archaeon]
MALVDEVREMQAQGMKEDNIVQQLKEQGYSPLSINQALEEARVKQAGGEPEFAYYIQEPSQENSTREVYESGMEPSLSEQTPAPAPQDETPEYVYPTPQPYTPEYQPYTGAADTETMTEIAEQITEEKLNKIKQELISLENFRIMAERKIRGMDERLKRIEEIIDRLQATILGKIGSYGQNLSDIKKEMEMMQESFSKALPALTSRQKPEASEKKTPKGRKKKSDGFEHYLR